MARRPFYVRQRNAWYFKYRPDPLGGWVKVKLCDHEGVARDAGTPRPPHEALVRARELADLEFRARHSTGPAPASPRPLRAYLDGYAEAQSLSRAPSTTRHLRRAIGTFADFAAGAGVTTIQGVTRATCRDYLEHRSREVAGTTLRSERGYLMGAWTRAVEDELIPVNPWSGARVQAKAEPSAPTFWDGAEVGRIAAACRMSWVRDLVLWMANTGLRVQTALACRWDWVEGGVLNIRPALNVKTTYPHVLGATAREILARRRAEVAEGPLLFPRQSGDGPIPYRTARDAISRAIRRAGVRPGSPHDFRHSYGRGLALRGVPVTVIQRQLGHATLAMTMRYCLAEEAQVGRFVEDIDLGGISGPNP